MPAVNDLLSASTVKRVQAMYPAFRSLPLNKLPWITTDGVAAVTGSKYGFIILSKNSESMYYVSLFYTPRSSLR
jgi:hypothetical protein